MAVAELFASFSRSNISVAKPADFTEVDFLVFLYELRNHFAFTPSSFRRLQAALVFRVRRVPLARIHHRLRRALSRFRLRSIC